MFGGNFITFVSFIVTIFYISYFKKHELSIHLENSKICI